VNIRRLTRCGAALVAVVLLYPATSLAQTDVVLTWNEIAVRTFIQQGQNPFAYARFAAIVQLAVFEAVNAITREYDSYVGIAAPADASVDAAAATAAYRVLKTYFPAAPGLDQPYASSLAAIPDGPSKTDGIATGEAAAAALIADRQNDGSSPPTISPVGSPEPGVWQLTLPPGCAPTATGGLFYHWQHVRPFGVPNVVAFRPDPPPSLTSQAFTNGYEEVQRVGSVNSTQRPQDRSDVALFFAASSPTFAFNMVARQVAEAEQRSTSDNARALALLNMAISDGLVASFATKYYYNFWRPETAIRFPDFYGNPNISPDPGYVPFITTPCFPSYPSNHATGSNAAAEMLRRIYGEGAHAITLSNPFNPAVANILLTYSTFNEICDDVDDARVYGGIHFRFDQVAGNRLGREVATDVYKNNLRKANSPP
jgi:hypothetical protein